jgi:hypothetical protein
MAATTEELTGQAHQLVSALSFFRTGDEGRRPSAPKARERGGEAARASKGSGYSAPSAASVAGKGVNLQLKEAHSDLDSEFERY